MQKLKFRYVFKKPNGHIIKYFTNIQHLEHGDMDSFLDSNFISIERDLIGRDLHTGRLDREGKEIYEGDIGKPRSRLLSSLWEVYWDERACQFRVCANNDKQFDKTHIVDWIDKVVGNIHENPELTSKED